MLRPGGGLDKTISTVTGGALGNAGDMRSNCLPPTTTIGRTVATAPLNPGYNSPSKPNYPANPNNWNPPAGWKETTAGVKTGGRHRQWVDENGNMRRRWDSEGREADKKQGPHWHDYDDASGGDCHVDPDG